MVIAEGGLCGAVDTKFPAEIDQATRIGCGERVLSGRSMKQKPDEGPRPAAQFSWNSRPEGRGDICLTYVKQCGI